MPVKQEFPPLLPFGFHPLSESELYDLVVGAFPLSQRRPMLWKNLQWLIAELRRLRLPCRLWIDGSFLTQKIEPDDIDLVADFEIKVLENLASDQQVFVENLADFKYRDDPMKLHTFVMFRAPLGHPARMQAEALERQWIRDFGYSFVNKTPKGIVLLEVVP